MIYLVSLMIMNLGSSDGVTLSLTLGIIEGTELCIADGDIFCAIDGMTDGNELGSILGVY